MGWAQTQDMANYESMQLLTFGLNRCGELPTMLESSRTPTMTLKVQQPTASRWLGLSPGWSSLQMSLATSWGVQWMASFATTLFSPSTWASLYIRQFIFILVTSCESACSSRSYWLIISWQHYASRAAAHSVYPHLWHVLGGHFFNLNTMHLMKLSRFLDTTHSKSFMNRVHHGTLETLCTLVLALLFINFCHTMFSH